MCGIIGCFSQNNCYEKLFSALRKLEYRGYDSAGIAMLAEGEGGGKISVRKKKGGAEGLAGAPMAGETGIGHTRPPPTQTPTRTSRASSRSCTTASSKIIPD